MNLLIATLILSGTICFLEGAPFLNLKTIKENNFLSDLMNKFIPGGQNTASTNAPPVELFNTPENAGLSTTTPSSGCNTIQNDNSGINTGGKGFGFGAKVWNPIRKWPMLELFSRTPWSKNGTGKTNGTDCADENIKLEDKALSTENSQNFIPDASKEPSIDQGSNSHDETLNNSQIPVGSENFQYRAPPMENVTPGFAEGQNNDQSNTSSAQEFSLSSTVTANIEVETEGEIITDRKVTSDVEFITDYPLKASVKATAPSEVLNGGKDISSVKATAPSEVLNGGKDISSGNATNDGDAIIDFPLTSAVEDTTNVEVTTDSTTPDEESSWFEEMCHTHTFSFCMKGHFVLSNNPMD